MGNNVTKYALIIFTAVNLLDFVTALFILPGESNPIFLLTKSIFFVLAFKIIINAVLFYYIYKNVYTSYFIYYSYLIVILYGIFMFCLGIISNIIGILNKDVVVSAAQLTTAEKVSSYSILILFFYLIPVSLSLLAFKLYEWSIEDIKLTRGKFKSNSWWKIRK